MSAFISSIPDFMGRVVRHEIARKGFASAAAGVVVAAVCEVLWPST